ncbi:uncharacterized oxidoreductase YrpG-like [Amphiura filiformis]|uniref:uncharacterized oxidoreductase YrpG-like n=1 Tax=Amphiura filiformis TaxID=82378 RepID=UPI003B220D24
MMSDLADEKATPGDVFQQIVDDDNMYRYLGSSGVSVSNICLGTMTFGVNPLGRPGQCDEKLAHQIMDRYVKLGGNFIDTANVYQFGLSEEIVGTWLTKQQREKIVLATKMRFTMDTKNPNSNGLSRKNIIWSLEESLKRLKTDYVDLYQIHAWDTATDIKELLRTMDDLVRCGKVRYIGASNVTGWQMQKIMDYCDFMGLNKWVSLQAQYSLLNRELELELTDVCKNEGLGILPWSPLKGGWLTGKIKKDMTAPPPGSRIEFAEKNPNLKYQSHPNFKYGEDERVWKVVDALEEVSKETGKSMSQIAIRWLIQQDTVSSVITGVKTLEQLEDNMKAAKGWELSKEQMKTLNKASYLTPPYPYEMIRRVNGGRKRTNWSK